MPGISVAVADTIAGLAAQIGVDPTGLSATVAAFNASIDTPDAVRPDDQGRPPSRRRAAEEQLGVTLETPPFYAYPVTCGITFTFGGLRGDTDGRVLDDHGAPIPGLFVCGEMLGGLFSGNYPGGTGLAAGAGLRLPGRRPGVALARILGPMEWPKVAVVLGCCCLPRLLPGHGEHDPHPGGSTDPELRGGGGGAVQVLFVGQPREDASSDDLTPADIASTLASTLLACRSCDARGGLSGVAWGSVGWPC